MKIQKSFKLFIAFFTSVMFLSACAAPSGEAPETVIKNTQSKVRDIKAADVSAVLTMKGIDQEDAIDFTAKGDLQIDHMVDTDKKISANLDIDGSLKAKEQAMTGAVALAIKIVGQEFFFKLDKFDSDDPSFAEYKMLIDPFKGKWLKLASDFVPENIKNIQGKDEEALAMERQLKDAFANADIFEVAKEYGTEKMNGLDVYHYGLKIKKDGLKNYYKELATIRGEEVTEEEADESVGFVDSISNVEVWIGMKDYYVYKAVVDSAGENTDDGVAADISLAYMANSYDQAVQIEAPAGAEEFNPLVLLMGMQMTGNMPEMTDEIMMEDEGMMESETE